MERSVWTGRNRQKTLEEAAEVIAYCVHELNKHIPDTWGVLLAACADALQAGETADVVLRRLGLTSF